MSKKQKQFVKEPLLLIFVIIPITFILGSIIILFTNYLVYNSKLYLSLIN